MGVPIAVLRCGALTGKLAPSSKEQSNEPNYLYDAF